jgi:hypothetical protein
MSRKRLREAPHQILQVLTITEREVEGPVLAGDEAIEAARDVVDQPAHHPVLLEVSRISLMMRATV